MNDAVMEDCEGASIFDRVTALSGSALVTRASLADAVRAACTGSDVAMSAAEEREITLAWTREQQREHTNVDKERHRQMIRWPHRWGDFAPAPPSITYAPCRTRPSRTRH